MNKLDLENRLIEFSALIVEVSRTLSSEYVSGYLSNQIIRSAISPALNYGEAQAGESRKDFIHKMKISLKELRETYVSLKIIRRTKLSSDELLLEKALDECNQLISIFVKSVETATKNLNS